MKIGRIVGALYSVATFLVAFLIPGDYVFKFWMSFWICISLQEVIFAAEKYKKLDGRNDTLSIYKDLPALQILVLIISAFATIYCTKNELALALIACYVSDTAAYIIGKNFGTTKVSFLKNISPNKSYAGYAAGIFLPIPIVYFIGSKLCFSPSPELWSFSIFAGLMASFGDLLGSATKRKLLIKDSSEAVKYRKFYSILEAPLIEGHGGYLDRMDSVSLVLVILLGILLICAPH